MGRDAEAAEVLKPIHRGMNVIENEGYLRLLLMYRGELPADSVLAVPPSGEMSVTDATAAYGVGNWYFYNGKRAPRLNASFDGSLAAVSGARSATSPPRRTWRDCSAGVADRCRNH